MKENRVGRTIFLLSLLFLSILCACDKTPQKAHFENLSTVPGLEAHTKEFDQQVIRVTDGVHVAVGFGLANSILIEGDDGAIVVDTMGTFEAGQAVRRAFAEITDKPIRAVIYTHNHADHVFGSEAFVDGPDIAVFAHETTGPMIDRVVGVLRPVLTQRSMRMFGNFLEDSSIVNAGIGRRLELATDSTVGVVRPNHTFSDSWKGRIAGIEVQLVHAPGETDDQIFVWLPEKRVLLPGDNIYKTFPNLYTIRGTAHRDVRRWVESIDKMRALRPAHLVPSHTRPVSGEQAIYNTLTDYRDAIAYVHDQTVRGMNMGKTPDELAASIKLPPHLAASPFLTEYYGTVAWSVRAIFNGYLGWFDGNPTHLDALPPMEKAEHMAALAGGKGAMLTAARQAAESGDHQWVLELTDCLLRLEPDNAEARNLRVAALTSLGQAQANPNARHYYLTRAAELGQQLHIGQMGRPTEQMLSGMPMGRFFDAMAVNLDAEKCADMERTVGFIFPDTDEAYSVLVRRGVAEIRPELVSPRDITVTVPSLVWKQMLAKERNPLATIATECDIEGGRVRFLSFMAMFAPEFEE